MSKSMGCAVSQRRSGYRDALFLCLICCLILAYTFYQVYKRRMRQLSSAAIRVVLQATSPHGYIMPFPSELHVYAQYRG